MQYLHVSFDHKGERRLTSKTGYKWNIFCYICEPITNWYGVDRDFSREVLGEKTKFEGKVDAVKSDKNNTLKCYTVQPSNLTLHSYVPQFLPMITYRPYNAYKKYQTDLRRAHICTL